MNVERQFIQQNQLAIGALSAFCNFPLLHDIQQSSEIICVFGIIYNTGPNATKATHNKIWTKSPNLKKEFAFILLNLKTIRFPVFNYVCIR